MVRGATLIVRAALRVLRRGRRQRTAAAAACCRSLTVRSDSDIRTAAFNMARPARQDASAAQELLRELVELNTPALYLNIVQTPRPARVVLVPWEGRTLRFRGRSYLVEAGSEAPEGIAAFVDVPSARVMTLYPTAPDHPVYAISIENQDEREIGGAIPAHITHVTILVNGRVIARGERLLRERGPQIWAA